jgi:hypothetical protein
VSDIADELDVDSGCFLARDSADLTCFFCYLQGHVWDDCPALRHLSKREKDEIAQRRKVYYTQGNRYRNYGSKITQEDAMDSGTKLLTRPGWLKDGKTVRP